MSINFLDSPCKEPARKDTIFGLCDDQNGAKAYSDTMSRNKWLAEVHNHNELGISFTPIDNCIQIFKPDTKDQEKTCDGMLTTENTLYLVELKDQAKGAISEAFEQLENTMICIF